MNEIKEEYEQTSSQGFSEKSARSATDENEEEDKQTSFQSSENSVASLLLWTSAQGPVDINSTDPVNQVLRRIQERVLKYIDLPADRYPHISVGVVPIVKDRNAIKLSIGPKQWKLRTGPGKMEVHKLNYLKDYVDRIHTDVEEIVGANFQGFKQIARVYREPKDWIEDDDEFVEMCILDGCFIIELLLKAAYYSPHPGIPDHDHASVAELGVNDPLFKPGLALEVIARDLIRPENQLPFEVLNILCKRIRLSGEMDIKDRHDDSKFIIDLALNFLQKIAPNQILNRTPLHLEHEKTDLLGILYDGLNWNMAKSTKNYNEPSIDRDSEWNMAKSATELEEFGVEFKMIEIGNFIDIRFMKKGVLEIPRLHIRRGTPHCIAALLWYERNHRHHKYLNNYLWFMTRLVKSPNDVQILRQKGIINNNSELLDDVDIHNFLKYLCEHQIQPPHDFNYIKVCRDLNSHCKHRRNSWMEKLKRNYFNSPWAYISFFAAFWLLILTFVQTGYSVASYYKSD